MIQGGQTSLAAVQLSVQKIQLKQHLTWLVFRQILREQKRVYHYSSRRMLGFVLMVSYRNSLLILLMRLIGLWNSKVLLLFLQVKSLEQKAMLRRLPQSLLQHSYVRSSVEQKEVKLQLTSFISCRLCNKSNTKVQRMHVSFGILSHWTSTLKRKRRAPSERWRSALIRFLMIHCFSPQTL